MNIFTIDNTIYIAGDADSDADGVKDSADGDDDYADDDYADDDDGDDYYADDDDDDDYADDDGFNNSQDKDEDHNRDGISNKVRVVNIVVYVNSPTPSETLRTMVKASREVTRVMTATTLRTTRMLTTMATELLMSTRSFEFILKQCHSAY